MPVVIGNVDMHNARCDQNIPCGSRVMNIFTNSVTDERTDSHGDYSANNSVGFATACSIMFFTLKDRGNIIFTPSHELYRHIEDDGQNGGGGGYSHFFFIRRLGPSIYRSPPNKIRNFKHPQIRFKILATPKQIPHSVP